MRAAIPTVLPRPEIEDSGPGLGRWIVTVFNNDTNTYDEVILVLMAATHCDFEEAYLEAWEIDHLGRSVVHCAAEEECERAAAVIATIGIRVEVSEG